MLPASPRMLLLMGVAGSGKTTIGRRLATELGWPYFEGDDFHSAANRDKMGRGIPLDDRDRAPWLAAIRARMDECLTAGRSAVFSCSALKQQYREILAQGTAAVSVVYLAIDPATARQRVSQRPGHFMKADMIQSQFAILEVPGDALILDAGQPVETLVAAIRKTLV